MSILKALLSDHRSTDTYKTQHEELTFEEYLTIVQKNPNILRNSFQRVADMIQSKGSSNIEVYGKTVKHHHFFDDPDNGGKDAIFGIDTQLNKIVNFFKNGANGYGAEKRILLLHGPVGSAKSSIARVIKKGYERYSMTDEGSLYTFEWHDEELSDILGGANKVISPMHEEPLKLLPKDERAKFIKTLTTENVNFPLAVAGDLNPHCRFVLDAYLEKHGGDLETVLRKHVRVKRFFISEKNRQGIGTFQPKDEKNQDSTELSGDINYRKIAQYGSDSDPRAFNFDGEFCISNRGVIEFIEMLKLDTAFLYDLLTASQEKCIKPKKFAQTDIDEIIIGHTNEPEYRKLTENEFMEALNDRTVKIDIPYILKLEDEIQIYKKDFNPDKFKLHIAPHTLRVASFFSIFTRLVEAKEMDLSKVEKLMLYNGKRISKNYNNHHIDKIKQDSDREGLEGISPRFIQDKISNAIIKNEDVGYIGPFQVITELEAGLKNHPLIKGEEELLMYKEAIEHARQELDRLLQKDIQSAIAVDQNAIQTLCSKYIDNLKAFVQREKIRDIYSNRLEEPDERFMRELEEHIDIPESRKEDFRREMMNNIGALAIEGKQFDYKSSQKLYQALEKKLFEDNKDQLQLSSIHSRVVDQQTQDKIEVIKARLIERFGYTVESAKDAMEYVSSLMAKGSK